MPEKPNPLVRKLENFVQLSAGDKHAIGRLSSDRVRRFGPREDVVREGDRPTYMHLFLSGWACRYKMLEDGRRQIVSFFLPGDLCDPNVFILREMDHSIAAITPVETAEITRAALDELTLGHPRITQALWWETLVSLSIQREWALNLGQRDAVERIAHLLCELYIRLKSVGLTRDGSCDFPLLQADVADATGISAVHVNRSLQELRAQGLIVLAGKVLDIPDFEKLQRAAFFNANYLHLEREGRHLDANDP